MPAIGRSTAPSGSSSNGKLSGSRGSGPESAVEREGGVGHGPRQQPLEHERARAAERVRAADERDPAERLLEAVDPAPRRGDPHRTAAVGPLRERQQPVGHRRGAAARRPAAVARGVERVAGRPEEDVVARRPEAHHRAVRLADHDRAGGLHPLGPHARRVDHVVAQRRDAAERRRPAGLEVEQVLDRGRDAVQRPERRAGGDRGVGLARAARAWSKARNTNAFSVGSRASMRAIVASSSSTAESRRSRIASASSVVDIQASSATVRRGAGPARTG